MYYDHSRRLREIFQASRIASTSDSKLVVFRNGVRQSSPKRSAPDPINDALIRSLRLQQSQIEILQQQVKAAQPSAAEMRKRKLAESQADVNRQRAMVRHAR